MATKKPRILLTLGEELLKRIDDFRFENRFNTRSEAIRHLLMAGLESFKSKTQRAKLTGKWMMNKAKKQEALQYSIQRPRRKVDFEKKEKP